MFVSYRASLLVSKRSAIPAAWQPTQATGRAGIVVKIVLIKTIVSCPVTGFGRTDIHAPPVSNFCRFGSLERLAVVEQHAHQTSETERVRALVQNILSRTSTARHEYSMSHKQSCDSRQPMSPAVRHCCPRGIDGNFCVGCHCQTSER